MNPTLPQAIVDEALAEDLAAAKAEYLGEFRSTSPRSYPVRLSKPVSWRTASSSARSRAYGTALRGHLGGRGDDAALAIAHRDAESQKIVVDLIRRWRPPFSPDCRGRWSTQYNPTACRTYWATATRRSLRSRRFETRGVKYGRSSGNVWSHNANSQVLKSRSQLYLEMLPRLCSREIELLR